MADPYQSERALLKAEILRRVSQEGVSLAAVGRAAGMPCSATIQGWARADDEFRAGLDRALAQRRAGRWAFDAERAAVVLGRYRAEETIAEIVRDPALPSAAVLARWRAAEPGFDAALARAQAADHARRGMAGIRRVKTPRAFDEAVADAVLVALVRGAQLKTLSRTHPGLPGRRLIARWRREQPEFDAEVKAAMRVGTARHGRAARACAALEERVIEGLVSGGSLLSLSREPGMPEVSTLYRWFRERREFRRKVDDACQDREDWFVDSVIDLARGATMANYRAVAREISELKRQLGRLAHRPGWKRRL